MYDLNNKRAEKLVDDLMSLSVTLLIESDPSTRDQTYNSIQEKLAFLKEALIRLRKGA